MNDKELYIWHMSVKLCVTIYKLGLEFPNTGPLQEYWKELSE